MGETLLVTLVGAAVIAAVIYLIVLIAKGGNRLFRFLRERWQFRIDWEDVGEGVKMIVSCVLALLIAGAICWAIGSAFLALFGWQPAFVRNAE